MKFGSGAWTRTRITSSKGWRATDCTTPEQPEKCSRAADACAMYPGQLHLARRFCYARSSATVERCPSGLRSTLGKRVLGKLNRGFESHPLRHSVFCASVSIIFASKYRNAHLQCAETDGETEAPPADTQLPTLDNFRLLLASAYSEARLA